MRVQALDTICDGGADLQRYSGAKGLATETAALLGKLQDRISSHEEVSVAFDMDRGTGQERMVRVAHLIRIGPDSSALASDVATDVQEPSNASGAPDAIPKGSRCVYTTADGDRSVVTIKKIHYDDVPPYYTMFGKVWYLRMIKLTS